MGNERRNDQIKEGIGKDLERLVDVLLGLVAAGVRVKVHQEVGVLAQAHSHQGKRLNVLGAPLFHGMKCLHQGALVHVELGHGMIHLLNLLAETVPVADVRGLGVAAAGEHVGQLQGDTNELGGGLRLPVDGDQSVHNQPEQFIRLLQLVGLQIGVGHFVVDPGHVHLLARLLDVQQRLLQHLNGLPVAPVLPVQHGPLHFVLDRVVVQPLPRVRAEHAEEGGPQRQWNNNGWWWWTLLPSLFCCILRHNQKPISSLSI